MDQECLRETRDADDETVPTYEQRKQDLFYYVVLTDYEFAHLFQHTLASRSQAVRKLNVVCRF
jgi:hypothetical protein